MTDPKEVQIAENMIEDSPSSEPQLKKGSISPLSAVIMSVSAAAPATCICGSLGAFIAGTGASVPLAFAIATVVIVIVAINIAQLAVKYSNAGGTYSYVKNAIGGKAGWFAGWTYIGICVGAGAIGSIFAIYLNACIPAIPLWVGVLAIVVPTFAVGLFGVDLSAKLIFILWVAATALLVIPAILVISHQTPVLAQMGISMGSQLASGFVPKLGISGLMAAVLLTVWSYIGFEVPAYLGEEIKGGGKSVKKAVPLGGLVVGIVYVVICWLWIVPMPPETVAALAGDEASLVTFVNMINMPGLQWFLMIAVLIACMACWFSFITAMSRMLFDMGRTGVMPKSLGVLNKFSSPHKAVVVLIIMWAIGALFGVYFDLNILLNMLATFASVAYISVCIANFVDRLHEKGVGSAIKNKILPIIGVVIMVIMICSQTPSILLICGIFLAIGLVVMAILRKRHGAGYFKSLKM